MNPIVYRLIYPFGMGTFIFFFLFLFYNEKKWKIFWVALMTMNLCFGIYFSMDIIKNDPVETSAYYIDAHRGSLELGYWDLTFQDDNAEKFNLSCKSKLVDEFEPKKRYSLVYSKRTGMLLSYDVIEE